MYKGEKLMFKSERIIIDTRKYDIDEIFERYKRGGLIFYEKGNAYNIRKNKITREVLEALSRGIPFPSVYVSELQTGELLVLDKSDRLRFLMEYLDHRFEINNTDYLFEKDIFYAPVILYVIDYINPKYMHMQVGSFIEEWSATQEQGVRNVLYQGEKKQIFDNLLSEIDYPKRSRLSIQYNFIYFIMVEFVISEKFHCQRYQGEDKFQLLENTIFEIGYMDERNLRDLCSRLEQFYYLIRQKNYIGGLLSHFSLEIQTKYLCFMNVWINLGGKGSLELIFEQKRIKNMIENCDMSYRSIIKIAECFREEYL